MATASQAGLSLNGSTGAITGTPTGAGTYTFAITATDSNKTNATSNCAKLIADC